MHDLQEDLKAKQEEIASQIRRQVSNFLNKLQQPRLSQCHRTGLLAATLPREI